MRDAELARDTRLRLWSEHLELPIDEIEGESGRGRRPPLGADRPRSSSTGCSSGLHLTHRLVKLPGVSVRHRRFLGPLQGRIYDA